MVMLDIIKKRSLLSNYINSPNATKGIEEYSEFIPYSRNKINFNELNNYIVKADKELDHYKIKRDEK